jgi:hypothetical protein
LVEALRYKVAVSSPDEVLGFSNPSGVDSVSNRNEYQEYALGG